MQFTALLSAFVFVATALAVPAPVEDSSIEVRAGAPSWEFHPFVDLGCQTSTGNILGGPQTPGSQCINIIERMGDKVISGSSTQGCKSKFPSPKPTSSEIFRLWLTRWVRLSLRFPQLQHQLQREP